MQNDKSIENMSFEEALKELEEIVKKIDSGNEHLESAINSFQRGVLLKNFCEEKLSKARMQIDKIVQDQNDKVALQPANLAESESI